MNIKLNEKKRDDVKALLADHQSVSDALLNQGKPGFDTQITVSKDDDSDFTSVDLTHQIAKRALTEQKNWIEAELKKLGIDLA